MYLAFQTGLIELVTYMNGKILMKFKIGPYTPKPKAQGVPT